ncbi:MAG: ATP-binding protein [Deltaproteobacteria bacterium]|nr:ATP-binding protein [Deltaproteobacteria bacterium]MBI3293247.1 ATP-binding protein [Deltaproteobacteria bacterium]
MVFLAGPRQVGKTTEALSLLGAEESSHAGYFNWDYPVQRDAIRTLLFPPRQRLIVLDEIHKYKKWRNLIKGAYDVQKSRHRFLVTGSARLDYYNRGGDSLQGRYHLLRLHPFSLSELKSLFPNVTLQNLFDYGGFPEPLFKRREIFSRRWRKERTDRVLSEDVRSLERVEEVSRLEELVAALPSRVGSPLSYNNLAQDLDVAPRTVKRWVDIFERLYLAFRIYPFGSPKIRAVKKESKLYLWDWSEISEPGVRFENMVACHLLKYCHFVEDTEGFRMELRYLRDTDAREVDFVVLKERKPIFAVECKYSNTSLSPHIRYFQTRTPVPQFFQVVFQSSIDWGDADVGGRVISFDRLCDLLHLP